MIDNKFIKKIFNLHYLYFKIIKIIYSPKMNLEINNFNNLIIKTKRLI